MAKRAFFCHFGISQNFILVLGCCLGLLPAIADSTTISKTGKQIYQYYCYQCHGYQGDANTTAALSVYPKPANFSAFTKQTLPRDRMVNALQNGVPGTAMVSFRSVLSDTEINSVVEYIRTRFMSETKPSIKYHSAQNGWNGFTNYDSGLYFESGKLTLVKPGTELSSLQRLDFQRYRATCITCHELEDTESQDAFWQLYSVSFPVGNYEEEGYWPESPVATYELHENPAQLVEMEPSAIAGAELFQSMCAHCHAEDGSSQNWIGTFLDPQPDDIKTSPLLHPGKEEQLISVIINGIPGTSMPAWKNMLDTMQLSQLLAYLQSFAVYVSSKQPIPHTTSNSSKWEEQSTFPSHAIANQGDLSMMSDHQKYEFSGESIYGFQNQTEY